MVDTNCFPLSSHAGFERPPSMRTSPGAFVWMTRRLSARARNSGVSVSYAFTVLAHIVSPPTSGITTPRRHVKLTGWSRNVTSVCQSAAGAPLAESTSSMSGWSGGDSIVGCPSVSGPRRRANATCRS